MKTIRRALVAALCAATMFAGSAATAASRPASGDTVPHAAGCPSTRTCRLYALESYRLPVTGGHATLSFLVQAASAQDDLAGAAREAARTWSAADPAVRLLAAGVTPLPVAAGDGRNTIGWGVLPATTLAKASVTRVHGKVTEADITLNVALPWSWTPCAPKNGACGSIAPVGSVLNRFDMQAVLTHEIGHWLGIGHLNGAAASELSMFMVPKPGERKQDTLALGDVLAVRAAYPCRCRAAQIATP